MKILKFIFKTLAVIAAIGVVALLAYIFISKKKAAQTTPEAKATEAT